MVSGRRLLLTAKPLVSILLGCLLCGGCGGSKARQPNDGGGKQVKEKDGNVASSEDKLPTGKRADATAVPSTNRKGLADGVSKDELWQIILFRPHGAAVPAKLGHSRYWSEDLTENGNKLRKRSIRTDLRVRRGTSETAQWLEFQSIEDSEGRLVRLETMMSAGQGTTMTTGRVVGKQLELETVVTASGAKPRRERHKVDWQKDYLGFFAINDSLKRRPMQPGEKRSLKYLEASTFLIVECSMQALEIETVALLDETVRLLHIRRSEKLGTSEVETHMWCDDKGKVLKESVVGRMEQYLSTKQQATGPWAAPEIDFIKAMMIKVRRVEEPHNTQHLTYRVKVRGKDSDAGDYFSRGPSQSVEELQDGSLKITVRQIRADSDLSDAKVRPPSPDDTAPNNLIQSDDKKILAMATGIAANEKDTWKLVCALERYVNEKIDLKDFSQAFATAAEVAETLQGDCTEHAVLLAALCRARKIPARVAVGLVYFVDRADQPQMAYHMWTEVFVRDRWLAMDATLGRGGIGAAHLKIADSNLAGASSFSTLLPLMQLANRLELSIDP